MCQRKMPSTGEPSCAAAKATLCDPKLRTVNTAAECGAADDWYYFSPWRKPGSAGVFDSCGVAGGHPPPACTNCYGGSVCEPWSPSRAPRVGWYVPPKQCVSLSVQAGGGWPPATPQLSKTPALPGLRHGEK